MMEDGSSSKEGGRRQKEMGKNHYADGRVHFLVKKGEEEKGCFPPWAIQKPA